MKEGWEYKKLGEVCDILNGFAFKSEKYVNEGIRVLRISNVQKGIIVDNDPKYYPYNEKNNISPYILNKNDLLMSLTGNVGRVGLLNEKLLPAALNQRVACLRVKNQTILILFLFHLLNSDKFENDCILNASGVAQKNMSTEWLKKYIIPIPSIKEQQQIVSELDLLSGVIEKQKAQLEELDKLAQSIFYDMFGDPCNNHKNFEVKPIEKVCILKAGKAIKAEELLNYSENLYPCYGGNGIRGYINRFSHDGTFPIIGRQGALCGNVNLANGQFYATEHAVVVTPIIDLNAIWLYYVLLNMRLGQYAHGVAQPGLSVKDISPLLMILPPLSLQQEFAAKVEAIEAMKVKVRQSLKEAETLFNERMNYYFN